jgi:hypothetical protein
MISGRWFKWNRLWLIIRDAASVLGFFAVIVEVLNFFPALINLSNFLKQESILFLLLIFALLYGLFKNRPKNKFVFNVNNRDIELSLQIGNMEGINSAYIVPVNSEFDMKLNGSVKEAKSIKSMVIQNYFGGDAEMLQKRISIELKSKLYTGQKDGKRYKLGTTVRLKTDDGKKSFYFVANSHKLNNERVEVGEEGLSTTLSALWAFIDQNGAKEPIAVPLLGTGMGRINMQREEVFKEIIRSFIPSCTDKIYCERMTIVIQDEDVTKYKIDVEKLVDFMRLQAQYADFNTNRGSLVGKPVKLDNN